MKRHPLEQKRTTELSLFELDEFQKFGTREHGPFF